MVGNKADLEDQREIGSAEAQEFAEDHNLLFMETSAVTGMNVDETFQQVTEKIIDLIDIGSIDPKDEVKSKISLF